MVGCEWSGVKGVTHISRPEDGFEAERRTADITTTTITTTNRRSRRRHD
jgi:hypothetical protein